MPRRASLQAAARDEMLREQRHAARAGTISFADMKVFCSKSEVSLAMFLPLLSAKVVHLSRHHDEGPQKCKRDV